MVELGFVISKSDASLFIYRHQSVVLYFLVYVDDVILTGSDSLVITQLVQLLNAEFPLKDLGDLHYFLGIECHKNSNGVVLSQRKYILDLLNKINMAICKLVGNPTSPSTKLFAFDLISMEDPSLYRNVVGSLKYLLFTRPDFAFSVNQVCQFMHARCLSHWKSMKRILRYLKQTMDCSLVLTPSHRSPALAAFSDAYYNALVL